MNGLVLETFRNYKDLVARLIVLQPRVDGVNVGNVTETGIQLGLDGLNGLLPGLVRFIGPLVRERPAIFVATIVLSIFEESLGEAQPAGQSGGTEIRIQHWIPEIYGYQ